MPEKKIAIILDDVLNELTNRLGQRLVSVVIFGSFARRDTHRYSDIDLLVIAKDLPKDWRERTAFELSFERLGLKWGVPLQVIMVEPRELEIGIDNITPLLLEIREGYRCLLDREEFFGAEMRRLAEIIVSRGVRKLADHKWEVPELARQ
jgi:predicted nucleotidyltransferase